MGNFLRSIIAPTHRRTLAFIILLLVAVAVPLTVQVSQQQQTLRQRAEAPDLNLRADISACPSSDITFRWDSLGSDIVYTLLQNPDTADSPYIPLSECTGTDIRSCTVSNLTRRDANSYIYFKLTATDGRTFGFGRINEEAFTRVSFPVCPPTPGYDECTVDPTSPFCTPTPTSAPAPTRIPTPTLVPTDVPDPTRSPRPTFTPTPTLTPTPTSTPISSNKKFLLYAYVYENSEPNPYNPTNQNADNLANIRVEKEVATNTFLFVQSGIVTYGNRYDFSGTEGKYKIILTPPKDFSVIGEPQKLVTLNASNIDFITKSIVMGFTIKKNTPNPTPTRTPTPVPAQPTASAVIPPTQPPSPTATAAPPAQIALNCPEGLKGDTSRKSQGDANCDGEINIADFAIWKSELTGKLTTKTADFNNNGSIDIEDFAIWKQTIQNQ